MFATCMYMQHPDKTLATYVEQMKHLEHTFKTYVYRYYNIYNIPIYFCNIDIQQMQHISKISETLENTHATCVFTLFLPYNATQSEGVGAADSGKLTAEDGGASWQRPAVPAPCLGPASDDPFPRRLAWV
jgi:hypothetical protein